MTELNKVEQKLIEKIVKLEFTDYHLIRQGKYRNVISLKPEGIARILTIIEEALPELAKELGYKSPQDCKTCEDDIISGFKSLTGGE